MRPDVNINDQETAGLGNYAVLNALMTEMLSFEELMPLLQRIAQILVETTEADNSLILLVDDVGDYLHVVAAEGSFTPNNIGQRRKIGEGFAGLAWTSKQKQYLPDADMLEVTKGFYPTNSQLLAVPLMKADELKGVAVLSAPGDETGFKNSLNRAEYFATLAGVAIANAQDREQHEVELSQVRALRDISENMHSFNDGYDLIQSVSKSLMKAMDISRVVYFYIEEGNNAQRTEVWIRQNGEILKGKSFSENVLEEGINGWCYTHSEPVHLPRYHRDPRESEKVRTTRIRENIGSTYCVPITSNDRVVAVISISRHLSHRDLNENEMNLFFSICGQISTALQNKELLDDVQFRAYHDSLTSLPNRSHFEKHLKTVVSTSTADRFGAVMLLDLDGFKTVNDTLGHHYGDELLMCVAKRFKSNLSANDFVARIGGDEFAIVVSELTDKASAMDIAERMRSCLEEKIVIDGVSVGVGVSIGVSYYPFDGNDADILLRNADEAMYQSKSNGRGGIVCFDHSMAVESKRRIRIEGELREALLQDELVLHYQPQVDVASGQVVSVEALLRWNHPVRGLLMPGEFISVAEESGVINQIDYWVLQAAVKQLLEWKASPCAHLRIGVNIAATQFVQAGFSEKLLQLLEQQDIPAHLMEIEVTESVMMTDIGRAVPTFEKLRSAGIRVAVDDFGTGYSSLSYLQDLPLDVLKIDRSFISHLTRTTCDESVANTIMLLAHRLGLETIAEGVETQDQLDAIRQLGCTLIQGYFFSKPVPASELHASMLRIERQNSSVQLRKAV